MDTSGAVVERYLYEPYGQVTIYDADWSDTRGTSSFSNEILSCGYRLDPESGLYHVRHRMYHPTLGRWLQRDPLAYVDGVSLYEYVGSAPPRATDPSGCTSVYPSPLENIGNGLVIRATAQNPNCTLPDLTDCSIGLNSSLPGPGGSGIIPPPPPIPQPFPLTITINYDEDERNAFIAFGGGVAPPTAPECYPRNRADYEDWIREQMESGAGIYEHAMPASAYRPPITATPAGNQGQDALPGDIEAYWENVVQRPEASHLGTIGDTISGWFHGGYEYAENKWKWLYAQGCSLVRDALTFAASIRDVGATGTRGSTIDPAKGSFAPSNLREQLAVEQAMSNPAAGKQVPIQKSDPRWPASEGWLKMQQRLTPGGDPVNVHYVYNPKTRAIDDFKIVTDGAK